MSLGTALAAVDELLAERALNAFFHGSWVPLPVGAVLEAQKKPHGLERGSDAVLEAARPAGAPPRYRAWFMTMDPRDIGRMGGATSYIYEVEPLDAVAAVNHEWRNAMLRDRHRTWGDPIMLEYARRYWEGAPSSEPGPPEYEWLTSKVKIVREVKNAPIVWGL